MKTLFRAFHVTDLHWAPLDRIPQSRTETFHDDTTAEWRALCAIARDTPSLNALLCSGDYFHLKNQKAYSPPDGEHYRVLANEAPVDILGIAGNHDLPKSNYEFVKGTAYDNLLHACQGKVKDVYLEPQTFDFPGGQVHIVGLPYYQLEDLLTKLPTLEYQLSQLKGLKIVLLHPDALPKADGSLPFDVISWPELLDQLPSANVLCLGHIHMSFPIYNRQGPRGPQFVSKPWSFGRLVKDYYATSEVLEHEHKPMYCDIHLTQADDGKVSLNLDYREIPYTPFALAFKKDSLRQAIEKSSKVASFITQLRRDHGSIENAFTVTDPAAYLAQMTIPDEVRTLINTYLADD